MLGIILSMCVSLGAAAMAATGSPPGVADVQFAGVSAAPLEAVSAAIGLESEQPLSLGVVEQDLRSIYALGYFRSVRALQAVSDDAVVLTYEVVEQPVIDGFVFSGAAEGDLGDLRSVVRLEEGRPWNVVQAIASRQEIARYYRRSGYSQAEVDFLSPPPDRAAWTAEFLIERGPRARIWAIEFLGNEFLSNTRLGALTGSGYRTFFDPEHLEHDMEAIEERYREHGFYFCEVSPERYEQLEKYGEPWVRVFLRVEEGPRVKMGRVSVEGNQVFRDSQIQAAFMPREGKPFDVFAARESIETIQGMYGAQGYLYAGVNNALQYDEQANRMNVRLLINEGDQIHVGDVRIEGNDTTQEMVFRHMLLLQPGDVFRSTLMVESWRRLYNLGFFESVVLEPVPTTDPAVLDLVVRVREMDRWGELYLGASYNGTYGFEGFVRFQRDNLWGQGKLVSIDWEFGAQTNNYEIAYADRWLFGSPTRLDLGLYSKDTRYEDEEEGYTKYQSGVEVGLSSPWFSNFTISLYAKRQSTIIGVIEGKDLPPDLTEESKTYFSLKPALKWDSRVRDKGFNPYKGLYAYGSWEKSGGFLGGDVDFNRYYLEARTYLRTAQFWTSPTIALRGRQMWGDNLPVDEEFYVGGQDSLRGYSINEFRGTNVLLGTAEVRVPMDETMLGYVFADAGRISRPDEEDIVKMGFGFGMKMQTAIGTLRLDYGISESGVGRFYFAIGDVF